MRPGAWRGCSCRDGRAPFRTPLGETTMPPHSYRARSEATRVGPNPGCAIENATMRSSILFGKAFSHLRPAALAWSEHLQAVKVDLAPATCSTSCGAPRPSCTPRRRWYECPPRPAAGGSRPACHPSLSAPAPRPLGGEGGSLSRARAHRGSPSWIPRGRTERAREIRQLPTPSRRMVQNCPNRGGNARDNRDHQPAHLDTQPRRLFSFHIARI